MALPTVSDDPDKAIDPADVQSVPVRVPPAARLAFAAVVNAPMEIPFSAESVAVVPADSGPVADIPPDEAASRRLVPAVAPVSAMGPPEMSMKVPAFKVAKVPPALAEMPRRAV